LKGKTMQISAILLASTLLAAAAAAPALATDAPAGHALAACEHLGDRPTSDQIGACTDAAARFLREHRELIAKARDEIRTHREAIAQAVSEIRTNEAAIREAARKIADDSEQLGEAGRAMGALKDRAPDDNGDATTPAH
jgi:hypothetical protein